MPKRDNVAEDDNVRILLDTFNDRGRAYVAYPRNRLRHGVRRATSRAKGGACHLKTEGQCLALPDNSVDMGFAFMVF